MLNKDERHIILDTETTGLSPKNGDRIVEIGCMETINLLPTGNNFHVYINPDGAKMSPGAYEVHGISLTFLQDKPLFSDIAQKFSEFVGSSPMVIHNAPFDMRFLNYELELLGNPPLPMSQAIDTLPLARKMLPKLRRHRLDDLCSYYNIDNSNRELHGALKDAQLLAKVFLALNGGRQRNIDFVKEQDNNNGANDSTMAAGAGAESPPPSDMINDLFEYTLSAQELEDHKEFMEKLKNKQLG